MKKVALVVSLLFVGGALADSVPTSVGYVGNAIGALQNKISAVNTNTVLTHTTTAGEIGQKAIYDTTGNYTEQTDALVTAEVANAAVQNAIEGEFVCTEWLSGAEHTNENCLIYSIMTSPNIVKPYSIGNAAYNPETGILTNTIVSPRGNTRADLRILIYDTTFASESVQTLFIGWIDHPQIIKQTFTTAADQHYLLIKHNDAADVYARIKVEPLTTYTIVVDLLGTNPSVIGGLQMKLMLVRGEWNHNYALAPGENVFLPSEN